MGRNSRRSSPAQPAAAAPQDTPATDPAAQAPAASPQDPAAAASAVAPDSAVPSAGGDPDAVAPAPSDDGNAPAAEQVGESIAAACAELGLAIDDAGNVEVEMLTGMSGPTICVTRGDRHTCTAPEAVRLVRAGAAQRRG